jgi:nitrogen fixation protein FixH
MCTGRDLAADLAQMLGHRLAVDARLMMAAPTARSGQIAPNRYAESWRLSRTAGGREPRSPQM